MENWLAHTRKKPYDFQARGFEHLIKQRVGALFADPGTGKTKMSLDMVCSRATEKKIHTVIVFAWPSTIHHQWVEEQVPKHWWKSVKIKTNAWNGKKMPEWCMTPSTENEVHFLTFNIESLVSKKVTEPLEKFVKQYGDGTMIIVDESQTIKNKNSGRWEELYNLGLKANIKLGIHCAFKLIMSGTPLAKTLLDEWAQFYFLDEKIIGIKYKTAFVNQFCVTGGYLNKEVIGSKNMEVFNRLIAPYTFRATKEELGLPPKNYDDIVFNITNEQRLAQEYLKETFIVELNKLKGQFEIDAPIDQLMRVSNVGSLFVKLQQIANGFMIDNDGELHVFKENPRIDTLQAFTEIERDKLVVWCRFRQDIRALKEHFGDRAVTYYGENNKAEKDEAKHKFLNDKATRFFIGHPASAGAGLDGLQTVCTTAAYYSNSFNSLERWQSEDRTNRIGSSLEVPSMYFDLIGRGTIDRHIQRNLKKKKSFSDLSLGDLMECINEIAT